MQPPKATFQQRFIEQTGVRAEEFTRAVLRRTLPLHAKLFLPLALLVDHTTLAADYDLIADIAQLTSRRDFSDSVSPRRFHPANRGPLRKVLRVRVSIAKLHKLVYNVMRPPAGQSS